MPRPTLPVLLVLGLLLGAAGCSDDEPDDGPSSTTGEQPTTAGDEAALDEVLVDAADLPAGFEAAAEVDDTITSFCATHDAASGLRASARAVTGFGRTGGGASVIQLAFRFEADGASRFVRQAEAALAACSGVPDGSGTGLAFEYGPLAPSVAAAIEDAGEARVGGFGTSVGSGALTVEIAVLQRGDVAVLVAVLGLDEPREALDELATSVFEAAATRLAA